MVSADTDPATPDRIAALGVDAFFPKPFSPAQVRRKLEQILWAVDDAPAAEEFGVFAEDEARQVGVGGAVDGVSHADRGKDAHSIGSSARVFPPTLLRLLPRLSAAALSASILDCARSS